MAKDISKRIRELRGAMKLTQSHFAELVNLSEDSIGKIERGVSAPTIETLNKIAEGLNIHLAELLGETQQKIKQQNPAIDEFAKYLKTKSPEDVRLLHKIAIMVLEKKKPTTKGR